MLRLSLAAVVLAVIPVITFADGRKQPESPGEAKPLRPDVKQANFVAPTTPPPPWTGPAIDVLPGYNYYGQHLQWQLWLDEHNCAPDGCPKPIGCGNAWTEWKFVFGSCRQFFGSAQSTVGHHYNTVERHR